MHQVDKIVRTCELRKATSWLLQNTIPLFFLYVDDILWLNYQGVIRYWYGAGFGCYSETITPAVSCHHLFLYMLAGFWIAWRCARDLLQENECIVDMMVLDLLLLFSFSFLGIGCYPLLSVYTVTDQAKSYPSAHGFGSE